MGLHRKFTGTLTRSSAASSGTQTVTGVGGKALILIFTAADDSDTQLNSSGWGDETGQRCTYGTTTAALPVIGSIVAITGLDASNAVRIITSGGSGWTGNVNNIAGDGFDITWTKLGSGRNITVKYIAFL